MFWLLLNLVLFMVDMFVVKSIGAERKFLIFYRTYIVYIYFSPHLFPERSWVFWSQSQSQCHVRNDNKNQDSSSLVMTSLISMQFSRLTWYFLSQLQFKIIKRVQLICLYMHFRIPNYPFTTFSTFSWVFSNKAYLICKSSMNWFYFWWVFFCYNLQHYILHLFLHKSNCKNISFMMTHGMHAT